MPSGRLHCIRELPHAPGSPFTRRCHHKATKAKACEGGSRRAKQVGEGGEVSKSRRREVGGDGKVEWGKGGKAGEAVEQGRSDKAGKAHRDRKVEAGKVHRDRKVVAGKETSKSSKVGAGGEAGESSGELNVGRGSEKGMASEAVKVQARVVMRVQAMGGTAV
eukprot:gene8543-10140_t